MRFDLRSSFLCKDKSLCTFIFLILQLLLFISCQKVEKPQLGGTLYLPGSNPYGFDPARDSEFTSSVFVMDRIYSSVYRGALSISISIISNKSGQLSVSSFLSISWIFLAFSILLGILAYSSIIKLYDEREKRQKDVEEMEKKRWVGRNIASGQFWIGFLGLVCFLIHGIFHI